MDISQEILSDITVHMKYAKYIPELQRRETWEELVTRNMNMHIKKYPKLEDEIRDVYKLVYDKKVLPSMRSLQFGGKPIEISPNRLFNCAYLPINHIESFSETMFLLLGGTGVGYSVQKHHVEELPEIRKPNSSRNRRYLISDSIEGWADSIKVLLKSYFGQITSTIEFDYSDIRPKGARLITSGGKAPGPQPLKDCIHKIKSILDSKQDGDKLTTIEVHDIICHIADAVLTGGIRRAALISFFNADDDEMISCKSGSWWELNPQRGRANNSAVLLRHKVTEEFFNDLWKRIEASGSGEPGIYFTNDKDWLSNPCCEIALRPFQFCNLCELNVSNIESQEDLNERVKATAFIGTLQAGYTNFHYLRDVWRRTTEKDALVGIGMTGIGSGVILNYDMKLAAKIAKEENARVAELIGINKAARTTCVKPSGCMEATTKIKTNLGVISLEEIFKVNEYAIDEFKERNNIWLNPTQKIYVKDKNNDDKLITKLYVNGVINDLVMIEFDNGDVVKVTPNHKFLTKENGWVRADELTENHEIINY